MSERLQVLEHLDSQLSTLEGAQVLENEALVRSLQEALRQADEICFALHRKRESYQKAFCLRHAALIGQCMALYRQVVTFRLERALERPVRTAQLRHQIESEREVMRRLQEEQKGLDSAIRDGTFEPEHFFYLKGCFYHVCSCAQEVLYHMEHGRMDRQDLVLARMILSFLMTWFDRSEKNIVQGE